MAREPRAGLDRNMPKIGAGAILGVGEAGVRSPHARISKSVGASTGDSQVLVLEDFPSTDDARVLSPNGRAHWATKRTARMEVASAVVVAATRAGLRPVAGRVRLTLRYVYPDRRKRDVDNLTTGVTKCAIDALVRGRWLPADDSGVVESVTAVPLVERGRRALEIVIEPVQP